MGGCRFFSLGSIDIWSWIIFLIGLSQCILGWLAVSLAALDAISIPFPTVWHPKIPWGAELPRLRVILKVQFMFIKQKYYDMLSSSFFSCVPSFSTFSDMRDSKVNEISVLEPRRRVEWHGYTYGTTCRCGVHTVL